MKYIYYPGCSLESSGKEYNTSTRSVMAALGADLRELNDWTCCGASAAEATSRLLSIVLPARNLALGRKSDPDSDFLVPCSSCYLNLRRVDDYVLRDDKLLPKINEALEEEGLEYRTGVRVRHLLDVLAKDFKPSDFAPLVKKSLAGLTVAPYYGCQALRPYADFDDPQDPGSMEPIIQSLGASVFPWEMGAKCCGAALMTTKKEVAMELTGAILDGARGADCIATVCPMCQLNLEAFQSSISKSRGQDLAIPILYLPQLMCIAFGLPKEDLRLDLNLAMTDAFRKRIGAA